MYCWRGAGAHGEGGAPMGDAVALTLQVSQEGMHTGFGTEWKSVLRGPQEEVHVAFSCGSAQKFSPLS